MKKVEIFILRDCPYCVKARKAVDELKSDSDSYALVSTVWIDESEEVDYANEHNYYHVPSVYYEGRKFFEAHPGDSLEKIKKGIQTAFDKAVYDGPGDEYIDSVRKGV